MKTAINVTMSAALIFFSHLAMADVQVDDARLNFDRQVIEIDVTYSGGCEAHNFELEIRSCNRTSPMTCVAQLHDRSGTDTCRELITETIEVPAFSELEKAPMSSLIILGTNGSAVHLPILR